MPDPSTESHAAPELNYSPTRAESRRRMIGLLALLPIALATALSIIVSLNSMWVRLTLSHPQTPWESAILCDAFRAATGQPVYESLKRNGHATHLYGALTSQTLGMIFRITGPSLYAGRIVTLLSSVAVCAILLLSFVDRRRWFDLWGFDLFVAAGLLIALHFRCRAYFVETRPDMVAMLLATLALCCFYRAHQSAELIAWYVPGIALIVAAFFFKQTYAAAAGVPIVAIVLSRPTPFLKQALIALTPLVAMVCVVMALKQAAPNVYFYMIAEPAMYRVSAGRLLLAVILIVTLAPLFFALAIWSAIDPSATQAWQIKLRWVIAACCVGAAAGIPAYAKRGGSYNSLLLGWMPMTTFCVAMIGPAMDRLRNCRPGELSQLAGGTLVGLLIAITTMAVPKSDLWNYDGSHGGPEFRAVIEAARSLEGRVICPDDPTITMFASNCVSRNLEAELDANGRSGFSRGLIGEIDRAKWMICVHANFDDGRFSPGVMSAFGFKRQSADRPPFDKTYSLWKRVRPPATQPTTAAIEPPKARRRVVERP